MPEEPEHKKDNVTLPRDTNVASGQPVDPVATTTDHPARPWLRSSERRSRRKPLIIVGIVSVVLLAIVWGAYTFWYQNPYKMLADALIHASSRQEVRGTGRIAIQQKDSDFDLTFEGGFGESGGMVSTDMNVPLENDSTVRISLQGIYDNEGNIYIKPENLKRAMNSVLMSYVSNLSGSEEVKIPASAIAEMKKMLTERIDPLLDKVDGKWIKTTTEELDGNDTMTGNQYSCGEKVIKEARSDKAVLQLYASMYEKNPFISIKDKLGTNAGSVGFLLAVDNAALKRFENDIKTTKPYIDYERCYDSRSDEEPEETSADNSYHIEVWVDQWSHKLTKLSGDVTSTKNGSTTKITFDVKPDFDTPVEFTVPSNALSLQDVTDDIKELTQNGALAPTVKPSGIRKPA